MSAALSPTSPARPPENRPPSNPGSRRGSCTANPSARSRLRPSDASAATAPQPECWASVTIGHTCAISIVPATPPTAVPHE